MTLNRRDRVFNFVVCLIDAVGFPLGFAFFSFGTILPTFLRHCGADDRTVGALAAVNALVVFLPGLFVVRYLRRLPRVRAYVFWVGLVERLALLPLAPAALWWGRTHPQWVVVTAFVCVFLHSLAMGVNMPAYWILIGKCVAPRWRGRLYGFAGGAAGLLGIGVDQMLRRVVLGGPDGGFPDGYARGFVLGFVLLVVSLAPFLWTREPVSAPSDEGGESGEDGLRRSDLAALWRDDRPFRRLVQGQMAFVLCWMAGPFFVLHAQKSLSAPSGAVGAYTAAGVFASAFGSLLCGWLADRFGNRPVLVGAMAVGVATFAAALGIGAPGAFTLVFLLSATAQSGAGIAANNLVMEFAGDPHRIGLYTSFFNLTTALPRGVAPLLGGELAERVGYRPVFVVGAVLAAVAVALTLRGHRSRGRMSAP